MICIRCKHDSKYKERGGRKCPGCQGEFAFEPKDGDPLTDAAFQHALERVSGNGHVRFGLENLYYEVCRIKRPKQMPVLGCLITALIPVALAIVTKRDARLFFGLVGGIALVIWVLGLLFPSHTVGIDQPRFQKMWERWLAVQGKPEGLIEKRPRERKPRAVEPDLTDYSFDRAVICDRERTVDLLLANNFHFENNCAILSIGGYPQDVFETVRGMLRKNPRLHVFALHDASEFGCRIAHRLAHDRLWFKGQGTVVDVGMRPAQAQPLKGLWLKAMTPVADAEGISAEEAAWLGKYSLELAAIRPEQVLKRLYRAVNRKLEKEEERAESDSDVFEIDSESFSADAGDGTGAADGFG